MKASTPPLVSVVIPTYNHAHFIGTALQSLTDQTHDRWEAIVVNNYSIDNTIEIIDSFSDQRIRRVDFHNHGVIATARNVAIKQARGEYVAFLDSDDIWYPEKLARCVAALEAGSDLVCHGERWVKEGTVLREVSYGPMARAKYNKLLYEGNCLSTSATVVRKSIIEKVNGFSEEPAINIAEDYDLWLRIARLTERFVFLPEMLGEFRIHSGNSSGAPLRAAKAELAVLERHFQHDNDIGWLLQVRRQRRRALVHYAAGRAFQLSGIPRSALACFKQAFYLSPFILRLYVAVGLAGLGLVGLWGKRDA